MENDEQHDQNIENEERTEDESSSRPHRAAAVRGIDRLEMSFDEKYIRMGVSVNS